MERFPAVSLDENEQMYWLKAQAAVDLRNWRYARQLLEALLQSAPWFEPARPLLRRVSEHEREG